MNMLSMSIRWVFKPYSALYLEVHREAEIVQDVKTKNPDNLSNLCDLLSSKMW